VEQPALKHEFKLRRIDPASWIANPPAPLAWIVPGWLPVGSATLLYGRGGTGKSLLAQQLMTAAAIGSDWLGVKVPPVKSYGLFSEDSESSLHHRQNAINSHYGTDLRAISDGGLVLVSGVGEDVTLIEFDRNGTPRLTPLWDQLEQQVMDLGVRLLVIDTAARTFGGNENVRREVTAFLGIACTKLAVKMNGAVLVLAHPSRAGEKEGHSGASTAWRGSARSVWTLGSPDTKHAMHHVAEARVLKLDKLNDGPSGVMKTLLLDRPTLSFRTINLETVEAQGERTLLAAMVNHDPDVSPLSASKNAGNYGPKVIAASPHGDGMSVDLLAGALDRAMKDGRVDTEAYRDKTHRNDSRRLVVTTAGREWLDTVKAELAQQDPDDDSSMDALLDA
jgi:hypothetical protein